MPKRTVMTILNTNEMSFRCHFLSTFPSSSNLREPTTITNRFPLSFYNSLALFHTLCSSEKVVAPSASTIRTYSPLTNAMPALTAPPLPLFFGY